MSERTATTIELYLEHLPDTHRQPLLTIQAWIADEASAADAEPVATSLKWGQPSYTVSGGTPIRLGYDDTDPKTPTVSLYMHCQTQLVETFRELYPDTDQPWTWIKTRELRLPADQPLPETMIRQFIQFALTYQRRKALLLLDG